MAFGQIWYSFAVSAMNTAQLLMKRCTASVKWIMKIARLQQYSHAAALLVAAFQNKAHNFEVVF